MSFPYVQTDVALIGAASIGVLNTAAVIPAVVIPNVTSLNSVGSSFTMTPAQIRDGLMYVVNDTDKTITLPTGADMNAFFVGLYGQTPPIGTCFQMSIINSTANIVTIATNTDFGESSSTANVIADHSSRLLYFYKTAVSANQWDCTF